MQLLSVLTESMAARVLRNVTIVTDRECVCPILAYLPPKRAPIFKRRKVTSQGSLVNHRQFANHPSLILPALSGIPSLDKRK